MEQSMDERSEESKQGRKMRKDSEKEKRCQA